MPTSQQHLCTKVLENINAKDDYLDKIDDGATEDDRITTAATALPPAVTKESRDPEWEEADPDSRRRYQVVEAILTGVNISHIVCGVVIVRSVVRRLCGAASLIVNTNT